MPSNPFKSPGLRIFFFDICAVVVTVDCKSQIEVSHLFRLVAQSLQALNVFLKCTLEGKYSHD